MRYRIFLPLIVSIIFYPLTLSVAQYSPDSVSYNGQIVGAIIYEGTPPEMKKLKIEKDLHVCDVTAQYEETIMVGENGGLKNVVVYIDEIEFGKSFRQNVVLDQKGCRFEPHIQFVGVNQRLTILNNDGILHNLHTFSTVNSPVNKAQPKFKKRLPITFKKSEFINIKCDVHSWMSAWIIVGPHPYYAITDETGRFSLSNIPPGQYTITMWHESLGKKSIQVEVTDEEAIVESSFKL